VLTGATLLDVEFRVVDTGNPFQSLERTSLLYGTVDGTAFGRD
jgi:hypothetical protein